MQARPSGARSRRFRIARWNIRMPPIPFLARKRDWKALRWMGAVRPHRLSGHACRGIRLGAPTAPPGRRSCWAQEAPGARRARASRVGTAFADMRLGTRIACWAQGAPAYRALRRERARTAPSQEGGGHAHRILAGIRAFLQEPQHHPGGTGAVHHAIDPEQAPAPDRARTGRAAGGDRAEEDAAHPRRVPLRQQGARHREPVRGNGPPVRGAEQAGDGGR